MRTRWLDPVVGAFAVLVAAWAVARWTGSGSEPAGADADRWSAIARALEPPRPAADSSFALASARNPFRFSGRPAAVPHGADPEVTVAPVARYRPALRLHAIVGGPPWRALVSGVPGRQGPMVLAAGDRADSLVVRTISADVVRIAGPDTAWTLTLRKERP